MRLNEERLWLQHQWQPSFRAVEASVTAECGFVYRGLHKYPGLLVSVNDLRPRKLMAAAAGVSYLAGLPMNMSNKEREFSIKGNKSVRGQVKAGVQRNGWGFAMDLDHVAALLEL